MKRRPRAYVGIPGPDGERLVLVILTDQPVAMYPLPLRLDLENHSPTGFAWGYHGSGPSQLALALLADALSDNRAASAAHQEFKRVVIAPLPEDEAWVLTEEDVNLYYDRLCKLVDDPPEAPAPG